MGITPACHANKNPSSPHQRPNDQSSNAHLLYESTTISSQSSLPSLPSPDLHIEHPITSLYQCISTLKGHSSYISTLALHGMSLYSGSSDQQIRIWTSIPSEPASSNNDSNSGHAVIACKSPVKSLVISGDNLFSSHHDHKIRIWTINHEYHRLRAILPTTKDRILSLLSPKNYVQVRRHKKCTWVQHFDVVSGLAISHDGSLLYSVSWDRALKIWRTSDFKCIDSVDSAHHDAINAVVVSKEGFIYTGSADTTIKVWKRLPNEKRHSLVETLERHRSAVNALTLSRDGSVLYSGACDRSVVVWERGSGQMAATGALRGHTKAILCLATTMTGNLVCSGSADRTVRVWMRRGGDRGGYSCLAVLEGHGGPIKSLAMVGVDPAIGNSSTYFIYSGSLDCDIKVWKLLVPSSEGDA